MTFTIIYVAAMTQTLCNEIRGESVVSQKFIVSKEGREREVPMVAEELLLALLRGAKEC